MSNDNPQRPPAISADFPFAVRDVQVHGARMAYIDEGSGDPIVFLRGERIARRTRSGSGCGSEASRIVRPNRREFRGSSS